MHTTVADHGASMSDPATPTNRSPRLVRHGEAVDDGDLGAAGRRQAVLLANRLTGTPISASLVCFNDTGHLGAS